MSDLIVVQTPTFRKAYKKLSSQAKYEVDRVILLLIDNPELGEKKKGDLAHTYVYQFKIANQLMLVAYQWDPKKQVLINLSVHENFYRDLKRIS